MATLAPPLVARCDDYDDCSGQVVNGTSRYAVTASEASDHHAVVLPEPRPLEIRSPEPVPISTAFPIHQDPGNLAPEAWQVPPNYHDHRQPELKPQGASDHLPVAPTPPPAVSKSSKSSKHSSKRSSRRRQDRPEYYGITEPATTTTTMSPPPVDAAPKPKPRPGATRMSRRPNTGWYEAIPAAPTPPALPPAREHGLIELTPAGHDRTDVHAHRHYRGLPAPPPPEDRGFVSLSPQQKRNTCSPTSSDSGYFSGGRTCSMTDAEREFENQPASPNPHGLIVLGGNDGSPQQQQPQRHYSDQGQEEYFHHGPHQPDGNHQPPQGNPHGLIVLSPNEGNPPEPRHFENQHHEHLYRDQQHHHHQGSPSQMDPLPAFIDLSLRDRPQEIGRSQQPQYPREGPEFRGTPPNSYQRASAEPSDWRGQGHAQSQWEHHDPPNHHHRPNDRLQEPILLNPQPSHHEPHEPRNMDPKGQLLRHGPHHLEQGYPPGHERNNPREMPRFIDTRGIAPSHQQMHPDERRHHHPHDHISPRHGPPHPDAFQHPRDDGSDVSERSGSAESSLTWMSGGSDDTPTLAGNHPFLRMKDSALHTIMKTFRGWQNQAPGREAQHYASGQQRRRRQASKNKGVFACPFAERNPAQYRDCYGCTLTRIRDVKLHLFRCHAMPNYCPRCMETFPGEETRDQHIREARCPPRPRASVDGITQAQKKQLARNFPSNMSPEDQWLAVYDILFPGSRRRPASPWVDTHLSDDIALFQEFMTKHGPRILSDIITLRGCVSWNLPNEERDLAAFQSCVVDEGVRNIVDQWANGAGITSTDVQPSRYDGGNTLVRQPQLAVDPRQNAWRLGPQNCEFRPGPAPRTGMRPTYQGHGPRFDAYTHASTNEIANMEMSMEQADENELMSMFFSGWHEPTHVPRYS